MSECWIANMTVLFVANMMMWCCGFKLSEASGDSQSVQQSVSSFSTTPGVWQTERETERCRVLTPHISQLAPWLAGRLARQTPGLRAAPALPLLSTQSNSIIHKKSLRFLREIKVAYTCLYSINEMIDMLLHGQDKKHNFLF